MTGTNGYGPKRNGIVTVLDVGTSKVGCLIARSTPAPHWLAEQGQPTQLKVIGFGLQRSQGIKSGVVIHMDSAEQAIRAAVDQAERMAGLTVEDVILSVSCGRLASDCFSASVAVTADAVRSQDIDRVLSAGRDYAARDGRMVLHALATGYRLDDNAGINDPRGMMGDRLAVDVHAVTVDDPPLKNLILCVERCHLSVAGIAAAPYASALATIVDDEAKLGATCIDLGAGTTTLAVFADGHFVYSDALALGGHHITLDLARSLTTPLEQAERIKTLYGCAFPTASDEGEIITFPTVGEEDVPQLNQISKATVAELLQPRVEQIFEAVSERLAASGLGAVAGQRVVLTGGGSQLTGLPELAKRVLGKSVRLGRPRLMAGLPEDTGPSFATAIGLLLQSERPDAELPSLSQGHFLRTGTGYLARVGQWIRESF